MEQEKLASELVEFLSTEPACIECLSCLSDKAEIEIEVAQSLTVTVAFKKGEVLAEPRKAMAPDFVFKGSPDAIAVLIAEKGLRPAQLGVKLVKQVIAGDITVAMPSNIFQITRKGYFKIVSIGGMEFLSELRDHNLASVSKIISALKRLRSKSS